jgi:hypothetical protein
MDAIQTSDASAVIFEGEIFFLAVFTGTALSLFLDHFLGLLNRLSGCHHGWHHAGLILVAVRGAVR